MKRNELKSLLLATIAMITFSCNQPQQNKEKSNSTVTTEVVASANEPVAQQPTPTLDKNVLNGDWTRTDAPYQIKITETTDDGKMKAGYFNPKSINVEKANWTITDGALKIYVELRDENYPGSHYTLFYYTDKDMLAGQYFQAVESVTYDVGFIRAK